MRVRLHLVVIGLHGGQVALAVRQAFELLREMKESGNTGLAEFDHVVMHAVEALTEMRCPEAIQGLYAWCKQVTGRRMTWVKSTSDFALGRWEKGNKDTHKNYNLSK